MTKQPVKKYTLIWFPKWYNVVLFMGDRKDINMTQICQGTKIAYAHTLILVKSLEEYGLARFTKHKNRRIKPACLTPKGLKIYGLINKLIKEVNDGIQH